MDFLQFILHCKCPGVSRVVVGFTYFVMTSSSFNSQIIPKELLKFRLDKQLGRLKQVIESSKNENRNRPTENGEEEDKFQLYQRILSWFIMGRLAKSEYDGILENILLTTELIGKNYLYIRHIHLCLSFRIT